MKYNRSLGCLLLLLLVCTSCGRLQLPSRGGGGGQAPPAQEGILIENNEKITTIYHTAQKVMQAAHSETSCVFQDVSTEALQMRELPDGSFVFNSFEAKCGDQVFQIRGLAPDGSVLTE